MSRIHVDPLCVFTFTHQEGYTYGCPFCVALGLARLQGPVKQNGHPPACWCPTCFPTGYEVEGRPE